MQQIVRIIAVTVFTLVIAGPAFAKCDPTVEPDLSDIANARAAVEANCDCAAAENHGSYVSCAVDQINANLQNKSCRGKVKRCAARSTCGKPGFVTCCITKNEKTKCKTKSSADLCVAPNDGTACVGQLPSCCDACVGGTCATTTTGVAPTTTAAPPTTLP